MKLLWHLSNTLYGTLKGYDAESLYFQAKVFQKVAVTCLTYQGVGKTYLVAFDSAKYERVLFVAHREEILKQAAVSFKNVRHSDDYGFFEGKQKDIGKSAQAGTEPKESRLTEV